MEIALFVVQLLTSVGAVSAALVAVWAVLSSRKAIRQDRERQILRDRHAAVVKLLAAFEAVRAIEGRTWQASEVGQVVQQQTKGYGEIRALLLASPEELPLLRDLYLNDSRTVPFDVVLKNIEEENIRKELVDVINTLRQNLSADPVGKALFPKEETPKPALTPSGSSPAPEPH